MTNDTVTALSDDVIYGILFECPDHAADVGVTEIDGKPLPQNRLPDFSPEGEARRGEMVRGWVERLANIPPERDSEEEALTRRVLGYVLVDGFQNRMLGLSGLPHADHIEPLTHLSGVHVAAMQLLANPPLQMSKEDVNAWLDRLNGLPAVLADTVRSLKERRQRGMVAPSIVLARAIGDIRRALGDEDGRDAYTNAVHKLVAIAGALQLHNRFDTAQELVSREVRPAYGALLEELELQLGVDRKDASASSRQNGDVFYAWRMQAYASTSLSPETAHLMGLEELKRLDDRFCEEFSKLGLSGTRAENFGAIAARTAYAEGEHGRVEAEHEIRHWVGEGATAMRPLFNLWPRADVAIEAIDRQDEASQHSHYLPPSDQRQGNGHFRPNIAHIVAAGKAETPIVCFHETWPGHHLQLALAAEAHLSAFRRAILFRAFLEGWAKYAEALPEEVGLGDPFVRIGRMRMELYSTATLVMDTGIHLHGWSLEEARDFFMIETCAPAALADMVILRSAAQPGELTPYKIGLLKFRDLRERFARARGASYRLSEFHDAVLKNGAIPMAVLDETVLGQANRHER